MACAKPLIVVSGEKTPIFNFLRNKHCSLLVSNNRNVNFTNAIRILANDKKLREELGLNGHNEIIKNYSQNAIIPKYVKLLNSL